MANILVVDDRPTNREFLVTLLGYQQHRLLEASDGAEALAIVKAHRPDLVITDILMPTMDGYEFVRQLRAEPDIATTTVIFYTAHYHRHEADAIASRCGVRHILTKPCDPEIILRIVEESLGAPVAVAELAMPEDFGQQHLRIVTDKLSQTVDDLRIQNQRMTALVDINLQLASERDPRQLLKNVCVVARDLFAAKHALLALGTRDTGADVVCFTSGMGTKTAATLELPVLSEGVVGSAFTERKSRRLANLSGDPRAVGLPLQHPPVHSLLVAPIVSLLHVYGWICLSDKVGAQEFSAEDERLLGILGAQVGRVYENGSLYAEIRQHAVLLEAEIVQRKQVQDALADSELRFRQMAENIRDVFFLVDTGSNRMLYVSPAFEEIWGRSRESVYADTDSWTAAVHPDDRAATLENYRQGASSGSFEFEYRIVRPDDSIRWMKVRGFPIRDDAAKVVRIAGIVQDITEHKHAETRIRQTAEELRESQRRFTDMLGNVELASVMLDRDARITFCNDYLLNLTGWRHEDVIGHDWFATFVPAQRDDGPGFFASLLDKTAATWHRENEILTRSGGLRSMRWHNVVLRSVAGDVVGSASIGEDITERKKAEEVLTKRAAELELFHRLSVGRELQMVELKKHINEMAKQAGQSPPYDLGFLNTEPGGKDQP